MATFYLTLEDIQSKFIYPIATACKKLNVSESYLKRLCRKYGIKRWPYRQIYSKNNTIKKNKKIPKKKDVVMLNNYENLYDLLDYFNNDSCKNLCEQLNNFNTDTVNSVHKCQNILPFNLNLNIEETTFIINKHNADNILPLNLSINIEDATDMINLYAFLL